MQEPVISMIYGIFLAGRNLHVCNLSLPKLDTIVLILTFRCTRSAHEMRSAHGHDRAHRWRSIRRAKEILEKLQSAAKPIKRK